MVGACGLDMTGTRTANDGDGRPPANTSSAGFDAGSNEELPLPLDASSAQADHTVPCSEPGARLFEGHCYFAQTPRSQSEAKAACASAGAHLVTVTSRAEHDFLAGIGTGDRWIGLQAAVPTNDRAQYKWITNEPTTVAFWYPNDPDNMGPCVAFRSALQSLESWVDRGCNESNPSICERE